MFHFRRLGIGTLPFSKTTTQIKTVLSRRISALQTAFLFVSQAYIVLDGYFGTYSAQQSETASETVFADT
jgi:hypothetical protein